MAKRMKLWVAGALLLAVGGTVLASNMGFKFVPNINQTGKYFTFSLPLNQNYVTADNIKQDVDTSCTGAASAIDRVNPSTGGSSHTTWNGTTPGTNFNVLKGQGYGVTVLANCLNWVIVGSHDPAFQYSFPDAGKYYLTSIPYHTTATVAQDLYASIPTCTTPGVCAIDKINVSTGGSSHTTWNGTTPGTNFQVKVGEAYGVILNAGSVMWTPSHY